MAGLVETARAGANLILDGVFLGGKSTQARWREALGDLPTPVGGRGLRPGSGRGAGSGAP